MATKRKKASRKPRKPSITTKFEAFAKALRVEIAKVRPATNPIEDLAEELRSLAYECDDVSSN